MTVFREFSDPRLARRGHRVTGVEAAAAMLAMA